MHKACLPHTPCPSLLLLPNITIQQIEQKNHGGRELCSELCSELCCRPEAMLVDRLASQRDFLYYGWYVELAVYLSTSLSLFKYLSIYLSIDLSISFVIPAISRYLALFRPLYLYIAIFLYLHRSTSLSIYLCITCDVSCCYDVVIPSSSEMLLKTFIRVAPSHISRKASLPEILFKAFIRVGPLSACGFRTLPSRLQMGTLRGNVHICSRDGSRPAF